MDYDDSFETLDELLKTINKAVQEEAGLEGTDITTHFFSYMFDNEDDVFEELDVKTGFFELSPLH